MAKTNADRPQGAGPPGPSVGPPESKKDRKAQVEKSLSAIFRDEAGNLPDLTRLDRRRPNAILYVSVGFISFIVILLVAVWAGFSVFKPFRGFQGQGLQIVVDGPERAVLGQETSYFVNWQNASSEPLATAEVRVSFPPDFNATKVEPQTTGDGFVWRLGTIPFGGRGTITIKGFFTGALGTQTAIQAVGTYRPASFNGDFETLTTRRVEYAESVLDGVIEKPAKALPGDKVRIGYVLRNTGANPLKGLEARITLPEGFVRDASATEALLEGRVARVAIGDLASGASTTAWVTGTFASGASGDLPIHAEAGSVGGDGTFQAAQKTDATLSVLSGDLLLKLVVNGSDTDRSVGMREPLRFALAYENTSPEEIKDVVLRVLFEPWSGATGTAPSEKAVGPVPVKNVRPQQFVDWSAFEDSSSGTVSGNAIIWDKDRIGVLERMPPQTDGTVEFSLPVAVSATGSAFGAFQVTAEATMAFVGKTAINRTIRTQPIVFRLRTDADVASEAWYFSEEGAPLGQGPLPPVVGQTTTYRIIWTLTKTLHELKPLRVSAVLSKGVTWPGNARVTAGDVAYDESSRTVSWTVNRLPADVDEAEADFDVQLTPAEADAGRFAQLLGETRLEATDVQIAEPIVRTKPGLTTDLQNDEGAKSKGVVRKP